jgi:hypothetical protein
LRWECGCVQDEHEAQPGKHRQSGLSDEPLRHARGERTDRAEERTEKAVAREDTRASIVRRGSREHRMLERQEHTHVPSARIERPEERDHEQRPKRGQRREAKTGREHQERRAEQQAPQREAVPPASHRERRERRAEQRRGAEHAYLELSQAEREEIGRQQDRDEAVGECTQRSRDE